MKEERNPGKLKLKMGELWFVVGAAALVIAGIVVTFHLARREKVRNAAPGFVLRDQDGRLTSLAQFRGKVVVVSFIDPECTQLCPLTTNSMMGALKLLGPAEAARVQLLGINVNGQKTTVADVADYTRAHGMEGRWRFLTGSPAQLRRVWKNYHVYVGRNKTGDVVHEAVTYLIDRNGDERDVYSTTMSYEGVGGAAQVLAKSIARLLPGPSAVAVPSPNSQQPSEPLSPIQTAGFTALGPKEKRVVVGGAHPHLMLFFAGWLGQDANLSKDLAALDTYAALARRQRWPSPVAVDELTTEPSPAEAKQVLAPLAAELHTPIVQDTRGTLADGYHVEDLPWIVLSLPSGKILWHHDGWLAAAALDRDVRKALASR